MNKKLMALALAVCALAATTSLTPIIAKASTAPQETGEQRLARVCEIVAQYKQETGHLPLRIRDVVPAELLRCPIYGRVYSYETPDINPRNRSPRQVQDYLRVLDTIDWSTVPYIICPCHFDPESSNGVDFSTGYPIPLPKEGVRYILYLSGFLNGQVRYTVYPEWQPLKALSEWTENNPEDGGGE